MSSAPKLITVAPVAQQPYAQTKSAHAVREWMQRGFKDGSLKRCSYGNIHKVDMIETHPDGRKEDIGDSVFIPVCQHSSFESNFSHLKDEMQSQLLRRSLGLVALQCPKDCTFYENRKWGWVKARKRSAIAAAAKAWKRFEALPWQTQVALVAFGVVIFAPRWSPAIVQILKAIMSR
jgi:hypothetical protein